MWKSALARLGFGAPRDNSNSTSRATDAGPEPLNDYVVVREGRAAILFPKSESVFYNPVQQFNRDLSVTCIKAWDNLYGEAAFEKSARGSRSKRQKVSVKNGDVRYIRILEALSATGLRAVRYAAEIPHVRQVVANDLLAEAVHSIERNVRYNKVQDIVTPNKDDANSLMYRTKDEKTKFHVIDLDPYGTATPFVDASMQSIEEDGLLLVTCTDLSVLAGNGYPEKCFALYGGVNMISHEATHESALRLVLNLLNQSAAKYKKTVEPLLCLSIDFYVRVFVKVKTSPIEVKNLQSNTMITYHCSQCGTFHNQPLGRRQERPSRKSKITKITKYSVAQKTPIGHKCKFCGGTFNLAGPMYAGPLHNREFIEEVLRINAEEHAQLDEIYGTRKRIEGMLTLAKKELQDSPFYFSPNHLSSILKLQVPPLRRIVAALGSLGYACSLTHAQPSTLKTNAPWEAIWFVMKESHGQPLDSSRMSENTTGYNIVNNMNDWLKDVPFDTTKISFENNDASKEVEDLRKLKIVKYQENPTKYWGPKARPAETSKKSEGKRLDA